jgi:ribosomal protein S18 acetylase RimI-like enzyme
LPPNPIEQFLKNAIDLFWNIEDEKMSKVRFATASDSERLLRSYIEIWKSLRELLPDSFVSLELEEISQAEYRRKLKEDMKGKDGIFLVAEEDHEIVGIALGRESSGVCSLRFLGVKKECRGKGVGSRLLERFIKEAGQRNAHKIWLFTSPHLVPAIRLYIKNGFLPEGFLRKHTRGLDMIIYSKFLQ